MKGPAIAIIGSGAIGLYYGTRLALTGLDVRFLLRGDLDQVRMHGTRIVEKNQVLELKPAQAFGSTVEIGPVDYALVSLKTTANAELPRLLPPLLGANTAVATLQNGMGNEELIAGIVGAQRVLGALCFIASTRTGPGEVTCYHPGVMRIGAYWGGGSPSDARARELAGLFQAAGVNCVAVENLSEQRWRKLVWNIPFNGLAIAAGGITTDRILADPKLAAEARALMHEVVAAAKLFGHEIPEKFIQTQFDVTIPMGPYQPSSLVDYLAGREVEVEAIWGEPLRRAQAAGARMPRLAALYEQLRALTSPVKRSGA